MIGQSFSPTQQDNGYQQRPQGGGQDTPLQQAIQILQLRMPHVFGAMAPAPAALLNAQTPLGFNPQAFLQRLMGGMGQSPMGGPMAPPFQVGGGPMAAAAPSPAAPSGPAPTPPFHFQPNPGGTAGYGPFQPQPEGPHPPRAFMNGRPTPSTR